MSADPPVQPLETPLENDQKWRSVTRWTSTVTMKSRFVSPFSSSMLLQVTGTGFVANVELLVELHDHERGIQEATFAFQIFVWLACRSSHLP